MSLNAISLCQKSIFWGMFSRQRVKQLTLIKLQQYFKWLHPTRCTSYSVGWGLSIITVCLLRNTLRLLHRSQICSKAAVQRKRKNVWLNYLGLTYIRALLNPSEQHWRPLQCSGFSIQGYHHGLVLTHLESPLAGYSCKKKRVFGGRWPITHVSYPRLNNVIPPGNVNV